VEGAADSLDFGRDGDSGSRDAAVVQPESVTANVRPTAQNAAGKAKAVAGQSLARVFGMRRFRIGRPVRDWGLGGDRRHMVIPPGLQCARG
jgi:hypothetical protein